MAGPIAPINLANPLTTIKPLSVPAGAGEEADGNLFHSMFQSAVNTVEGSQAQADKAVEDFLSGNSEDVHSTVIATQRANLTFEMFMQVRNKLVSAYQEIMRMQV